VDAPRELTLTLPPDLAQIVRERIETDGYANETEVIREALSALSDDRIAHDGDFETTVRTRYAAWSAGTQPTISMEDIRAEFAAERASPLE
jgi:Arc/MetJ-type ribon-helix-helix transcriptional regulator